MNPQKIMKNAETHSVNVFYVLFCVFMLANAMEEVKEEVEKVIENEITQRLSEDLLQSIERKFQVDLEKSVDMVLVKIRLLLQNGTTHIQDKLEELELQLSAMKKDAEEKVDTCLTTKENRTVALAEKALHQMVVCGYALIGHDPAQAVKSVMTLKNMIRDGMKPIYKQKQEVYNLLKFCGHEHDSLKKVIKCVISKSPIIKSAMMEVTSKLIEGIVNLTKLMAHGAMHEACLIEVIKSIEDEAFDLVSEVKKCSTGNSSLSNDIDNNLEEINGTVLDEFNQPKEPNVKTEENKEDLDEMKELLRRMLSEKGQDIDKKFKKKLLKLQKDLSFDTDNAITNDSVKKNIDK